MKYLTIGGNAKTTKSDAGGEYLTAVMYLIPDLDLCPMSEKAGCAAACLVTAGRGALQSVRNGRQRKTHAFKMSPTLFVDELVYDLVKADKRARKAGVKLAVRLNGTSDIAWENIPGSGGSTLMEIFPDVQFYDYTKLPGRKVQDNYFLAASYSEVNPAYAKKVLNSPLTTIMVFRGSVPQTWHGLPVIDGDTHDLIFKHPVGSIIGLTAKGKASTDTSGFVLDVNPEIIASA